MSPCSGVRKSAAQPTRGGPAPRPKAVSGSETQADAMARAFGQTTLCTAAKIDGMIKSVPGATLR